MSVLEKSICNLLNQWKTLKGAARKLLKPNRKYEIPSLMGKKKCNLKEN
jgi:hypothetical protein